MPRPAIRQPCWALWTRAWLILLLLTALWPMATQAQFIQQYFPPAVPGYEEEPGVTVDSRLRPGYDSPGVAAGDFVVHGNLLEATGYNSNVTGFPNGAGSWALRTTPALSINSDWSRDRFGAAFSASDVKFVSTPNQDYTDWNGTIGGGYTIAHGELVAGYSHLALHEEPTQIGGALSATPIPYQVDDARVSYSFSEGRFTFTPKVDVQHYEFGDATLLGVPVSQSSQNRVVTTGATETRYALSDQRNLVFVFEGIDSAYVNTPIGQPTESSTSVLAFGGLDYQATGPWRYRALLGIENRSFAAPQFAAHTAPVAEASVTWTPTGMTTLTGALSRTIEDPAAAGTSGYTYTRAQFSIDHEYRRNVLLQGRLGFESANYLQGGGTQARVSAGGGARWLVSEHVQLALDYTFTDQTGTNQTGGNASAASAIPRGGGFTRNAVMLSARFIL